MPVLSGPVITVYPRSMARKERPSLIEPAFGISDKNEEPHELPIIFPLKEKAVIYTHEWLAPIIYAFEAGRGVLVIRDVLSPSPYASYTITTVGGERVKKSVEVGVVYINTKPVYIGIKDDYDGLTKERLRVGVELKGLTLKVSDVTGFLANLWRNYGSVNADPLIRDLKKAFRRASQRMLSELSIEDLLTRPVDIEDKYAQELSPILESVKLSLISLDLRTKVSQDVYEYYFWHIVNEVPTNYAFLLKVLNSIPKEIQERIPRAIELLVLGIISKTNPEIANLIPLIISGAKEEARGGVKEVKGR